MKIQKKMFLAAVLFLTVFLCSCGNSSGGNIVQTRMGSGSTVSDTQKNENTAETESLVLPEEDESIAELYMITKIDSVNKVVVFEKITNGRQQQYGYNVGTQFLDKYGNSMPLDSLLPGDVAEIQVSGHTEQLEKVQMSDEVWVQDDIVNYSVDESIQAFKIGRTKYAYDEDLMIFSGEVQIHFADLGSEDTLRAVGLDKKLLSLSVSKGHGFLSLANTKIFEGSFICVGNKIFQEITPDMKLEVPEGKHLVTVANNGYGGSKEVTITRGQTTALNLDELKGEGPKICKITFDVGVEDASLQIDGKEVDYSKPVEVPYGIHNIAVGAKGYDTITQKLVVNSKEAEIEIALNSASAETSKEKTSSENTDKDSNANQNNTNQSNTNNNTGNTTANNGSNGTGNNSQNNNSSSSADTSSTDYLTTLYNLLTSINNNSNSSNSNNSDGSGTNSGAGSSYDDLRDQ